MKVEQLMKREVKVCSAADSLNRAAQLMWEADCGCVPVISSNGDGALVGIVTDRDIAIAAYTQGKPLAEIPVSVAMAKKVIACHTGDGLRHAEALMRQNRVRRMPVLDQNHRVAGILSLNDIALEAQREKAGGRPQEVTADDVAETIAAVCEPRGGREMIVAA
jgi:CBS domain-containing protein